MDRAPSGVLGAHQVQRAQQRLDDSALRFHVGWVRPVREGRGGRPARARLVSLAHLSTHQRRPTSRKRPNLAPMGPDTCPVSIEDSSGFVWVAVSAKTPASRAAPLARDPCESQQCTRLTQNGSERPSLPICVHSCVSTSVYNSATVYTSAPKRLREAISTNLCTLLRPPGLARDRAGSRVPRCRRPHGPCDAQFLLNQNTRALWTETHVTAPVTSSLPGR